MKIKQGLSKSSPGDRKNFVPKLHTHFCLAKSAVVFYEDAAFTEEVGRGAAALAKSLRINVTGYVVSPSHQTLFPSQPEPPSRRLSPGSIEKSLIGLFCPQK